MSITKCVERLYVRMCICMCVRWLRAPIPAITHVYCLQTFTVQATRFVSPSARVVSHDLAQSKVEDNPGRVRVATFSPSFGVSRRDWSTCVRFRANSTQRGLNTLAACRSLTRLIQIANYFLLSYAVFFNFKRNHFLTQRMQLEDV